MFELIRPTQPHGLLCIDVYQATRRLGEAVVTRYLNTEPFAECVAQVAATADLPAVQVSFTGWSCARLEDGVLTVCDWPYVFGEPFYYV